MFESLFRMTGSDQLALPNVQDWSGGLAGCLGVVETVFRMSESGLEALPEVQKWSRGPP